MKGGEGNGICGKIEKCARGSRSSIKEGSRGDEKICRQKKKKNRGIEEGRQSNAKYKRFSIQRKTSTQVCGEICGSV